MCPAQGRCIGPVVAAVQDELSMRSAELAMLRDEHVRLCLSRARAVVPTDSRARMTRVWGWVDMHRDLRVSF